MVMYFVYFVFLILIAIILFVISKLAENTGARAGFVALSGLTLMLTGLLTWVNGLSLPIVSSTTESAGTTTINYIVLTAVVGNELWVGVNLLFWLGAVVIIHSLIRGFQDMKEAKEQKEWEV